MDFDTKFKSESHLGAGTKFQTLNRDSTQLWRILVPFGPTVCSLVLRNNFVSKLLILTWNSRRSASFERHGDGLLFIWVGNLPMETSKPVSLLKKIQALRFGRGISDSTKMLWHKIKNLRYRWVVRGIRWRSGSIDRGSGQGRRGAIVGSPLDSYSSYFRA